MVLFFRVEDGLIRPPRPAASTLWSGRDRTSMIVAQARRISSGLALSGGVILITLGSYWQKPAKHGKVRVSEHREQVERRKALAQPAPRPAA